MVVIREDITKADDVDDALPPSRGAHSRQSNTSARAMVVAGSALFPLRKMAPREAFATTAPTPSRRHDGQ